MSTDDINRSRYPTLIDDTCLDSEILTIEEHLEIINKFMGSSLDKSYNEMLNIISGDEGLEATLFFDKCERGENYVEFYINVRVYRMNWTNCREISRATLSRTDNIFSNYNTYKLLDCFEETRKYKDTYKRILIMNKLKEND